MTPARAGQEVPPGARWDGRWPLLAAAGWLVVVAFAAAYQVAVVVPREHGRTVREWRLRLEATLVERELAVAEWVEDGVRGAGHVARALAAERTGETQERGAAAAVWALAVPAVEATDRADFLGAWLYGGELELLGMSAGVTPLDGACLQVVRRATEGGSGVADIETCQGARPLALFATRAAPDVTGGARILVLGMDPTLWLYPRLMHESVPTATGESVLVGRSGGDAVFLSPLRHAEAAPGTLRLPLSTPMLPSPGALAGTPTFGHYRDYRRVPVLAAARPVGGTPFALVVKVDEAEALAGSRRHVVEGAGVILAVLIAFAAAAIALWRGARVAHYRGLAASHAEIAELFEHGPDAGIVITDGMITAANHAAGELFACPPAALVGMLPWQLNPPLQSDGSSSETALRTWTGRLRSGARRRLDWRCRRLDGAEFDAEVSVSVIGGTPARALVWLRDVSEERALRERLRLLVEGSSLFFFYVQELDFSLSYVSPSVERITGRAVEEWLRQTGWFTTESPINETARRHTRAHLRGEFDSEPVLVEVRHADGHPVTLEVYEFGRYAGARLVGLHGVAHDVTERVSAVQALAESEKRFRSLVTSLGEGVGIVDPSEVVHHANPAAERIFGVAAGGLVGRSLEEFVTVESGARLRAETARRQQGESGTYEVEVLRQHGEKRTVVLTATPQRGSGGSIVGSFVIFRDVTDRRRLEQHLLQAQKMEAVGRLAGGIAHDFNNLLQAMMGLSQSLAARSGDPGYARGAADELAGHVRRGASLARQLLLFSRRETTRFEVLDLTALIDQVAGLLRRLVRENIGIHLEPAPAPMPVRGDQGQLEQVLINLAVNAADAMPEGGSLTIRAGGAGREEVWFEVADTGHGVPEEIRTRIFEPFFTTKGADKGTGLGLSVVHGIVTAHGGRVELESGMATGTTFRVTLPRADTLAAPAEPTEGAAEASPEANHGERILVVEDEPAARESLVDLLTMLGYQVTAVGSGELAGLLPADPAFDLLLTDLLLPGVSGADLARGLCDRWPELKVVLMSGYTEDDEVRGAVRSGTVRFLQKPFTIDALARELRAALGSAAGA